MDTQELILNQLRAYCADYTITQEEVKRASNGIRLKGSIYDSFETLKQNIITNRQNDVLVRVYRRIHGDYDGKSTRN